MTIKPKRKRGMLRRTALLMTALVLLLQLTGCASIIHRLAFPRSAIVPETVEVQGETYYLIDLDNYNMDLIVTLDGKISETPDY